VKVPEPTVDETIEILRGLRERYEIHHKLRYTDEALIAAAKLSYQYIRCVTSADHVNKYKQNTLEA
jgi:ATP-dependent Clp protease ATP-binding subunit ClpC